MLFLNKAIEKLQKIVDESQNIVFFGGAGVSTESGIPDFRSTSGLYRQEWKYPPETILSHGFFITDTEEFYRFYRAKMLITDVKPNAAHLKLAELEQKGKLKAVITQNIDGLHQAAGSKCVYELHGSILRNYCMECRQFYDAEYIKNYKPKDENGNLIENPTLKQLVPVCSCSDCRGTVKPDVVLYEEGLDNQTMENSINAIASCDTLIVGGTSLAVYPAAGLLRYFKGENLVLINKSHTNYDYKATLRVSAPIGEVLSKIEVR